MREKVFITNERLYSHRKAHGVVKRKRLIAMSASKSRCKVCKKVVTALKDHVDRVHGKKQRFSCKDCQKGFFSKKDFNKHVKNVHTSERRSACDQCPKVYKNDDMLNDHLKRKHSGDRFDHPCTSCPKRFKVRRVLKKHMEVHISKDNEKIDCKTD